MGETSARIAEAVAKDFNGSNARKMVTEALRAFGTDLQTMTMTKASVKAVERISGFRS